MELCQVSTPGLWEAMSCVEDDESSVSTATLSSDAGFVEWERMDVLMDSYEYRAVAR